MTTLQIKVPSEALASFCIKWKVRELAIFGSALRPDFRPDSGVDLLVDFKPGARRTLFDLVEMQEELQAIFGRSVDLVTRDGVERSENYIIRREILSTAQTLYAAA